MKRNIPNMITCCNLLSGAVAVYEATQCDFVLCFLFIIIGALFDFCDGLTARALKVSSPIGKELDSLADDITFGLAPSMSLFCYLRPEIGGWAAIALLMAAFSALRLAKFNLDERQTSSFIGLATPANAIYWASLVCGFNSFIALNATYIITLLLLSLISCYLLIAEIPFFSLKFHNMKWADNQRTFIFLIVAAIILLGGIVFCILSNIATWYERLIPAGACIMVVYILFNIFRKK